MLSGLAALLDRGQGIFTWSDARADLLANAVRSGHLIRLYPQIYVARDGLDTHLRRRAAMRYIGPRGALSHTTALDLWDLRPSAPGEPIHVSVDRRSRKRCGAGLIVHHRANFDHIWRTVRQNLTVVDAAEAVAGSWPLLLPAERRRMVIEAVRRRLARPAQLRRAIPAKANGAREFHELVQLLATGCQSELEIWGALNVFTGPDMPAFKRQYAVKALGRLFYLDLFAERERVAFELDGASFHGDKARRERDIRRDAALATLGIQVVRFSYQRLVYTPEAVRREVLAILAARRRSLP